MSLIVRDTIGATPLTHQKFARNLAGNPLWILPLESSKPSIGISIISIGFRASLRASIAITTIRSTGTLGMQSRQLADRSWQRSSVVTNGLLTAHAPCLLPTEAC